MIVNLNQIRARKNFHMTPEQQALFDDIEDFDFDGGEVEFSFSQRLARESKWSTEFTWRVISEYRKFAFLAMVSGHPVTPSDQVDQAWHLHLLYTESYWNRFCQNVLKRPLHHGPTKGGQVEKEKYKNWYLKTIDSYQKFFGEKPADDIWPPPNIRFEIKMYTQASNQHILVVRKKTIYLLGSLLAVIAGMIEMFKL